MTESGRRFYVIRKTASGLEIEIQCDKETINDAYVELEELWTELDQLDETLRPKRRLLDLERECQKYWDEADGKYEIKQKEVTSVSHRIALSVLNGGNKGKTLTRIAADIKSTLPHVRYHLDEARGASEWYEQTEDKLWMLTFEGIERIEKTVLPYLLERHGNELHRILRWLDKRIFGNQYDNWLFGKTQGKVNKTDYLEFAVGLLLSTIGFSVYQVGMYNDHFDIIAYSSDGPTVVFCECTVGSVRKKASTLRSVVSEMKIEFPDVAVEGIVVTTQRISKTDRKDLLSDDIRIVDITQIRELMKIAKSDLNPELLFDVIRRKEPV